MGQNKKFFFACLLLLLFSYLSAKNIQVNKTIEPNVSSVGETVRICIDILPEIENNAKADIVWVIDTTGSMADGINNIQNNLNYFTSQIASRGINYRQALVEYKDVTVDGPAIVRGFAVNDSEFLSWISNILVGGGGDEPESGLEALIDANTVSWRVDASKTMIIVTDAPVKCKESGNGPLSISYTATELFNQGVVIHAVCNMNNTRDIPTYSGGIILNYSAPSSEWDNFLTQLGQQISSYTNIIVRDPLPDQLVPTGNICGATVNSNELIWTFISLPAGMQTNVCCFDALITTAFEGYIYNVAYASADDVTETASEKKYLFYPTKTSTNTFTPTYTLTHTITPTYTNTPTFTSTPTFTPTLIPVVLNWLGAFPNPSVYESNIVFSLSRFNPCIIKIYTVSGELVRMESVEGITGNNVYTWKTTNRADRKVSSGIYIVSIETVDYAYNKKRSIVWGKVSVVR